MSVEKCGMENEAGQKYADSATKKFWLTTAKPVTPPPEQMKVKSDMTEHGGTDAEKD